MNLKPTAKVPFPEMLECLRTAWDTTGGQSLRSLIWSLYNGRASVPLWEAWTDLDWGLQREFARLMPMGLELRAEAIKRLLVESGEWDRIDTVPLRWEAQEKTD